MSIKDDHERIAARYPGILSALARGPDEGATMGRFFTSAGGPKREDDGILTLADIKRTMEFIPKRQPGEFNGNIIESLHMVDTHEDWSRVRSHGRARRRRAKHRQNIRLYNVPKPGFVKLPDGTMVGHPETVRALYAKVGDGIARRLDEILRRALYGDQLKGEWSPPGGKKK